MGNIQESDYFWLVKFSLSQDSPSENAGRKEKERRLRSWYLEGNIDIPILK
jgi:hypothetical protein